jgi:hypothetical protein
MTIRATIDKAGAFPVVQRPCPHFNQRVDWNAPPAGIIHTTEGPTEEGALGVFHQHWAPHFVVGLDHAHKLEITQCVPVGYIGAAIAAHNALARVQIEVVAFSKTSLWLPDAQTLDALASLMNVCLEEWQIPLFHPWADGDFGRAGNNPHRGSGKFGKVSAWFGHGDCPLPDNHWDPGALAWSKVFERAKELEAAAA